MEGFTGDGVEEKELCRVEGRAGDGAPLRPIEKVPRQGMAQVGHVDPDLMGAARVQLQPEEGEAAVAGEHPVPGAGLLPIGPDLPGDEGAVHPADGGLHHSLGGGRGAQADRQVDAAEGGCVELTLEHLLGVGVLGHHHQAAGALVQAVDGVKVGAPFPVCVIMGQEVVAQSVVPVAGARVGGDAGGLVNHHHVLVLIDDIQGPDHAGDATPAGQVPHLDGEDLPLAGNGAGEDPHPIQGNPVLQAFGAADYRARETQRSTEQGVHLPPIQVGGDG